MDIKGTDIQFWKIAVKNKPFLLKTNNEFFLLSITVCLFVCLSCLFDYFLFDFLFVFYIGPLVLNLLFILHWEINKYVKFIQFYLSWSHGIFLHITFTWTDLSSIITCIMYVIVFISYDCSRWYSDLIYFNWYKWK